MMQKEKQLNLLGKGFLFLATLIWGTSFTVLKNSIETLPVMFVLAIRFFTSALVLFIVFYKRFLVISKRTLITGLVLGCILASAYLLQTYGLVGVSAGENAFLTSTYIILVPFMCWFFFKRRPDVFSFVAGGVCLLGIGMIAFSGGDGFSIGLGQGLTLVCAIFYALQIIVISHYGSKEDPMVTLCLELGVVGVVCLIGSLAFEVGRTEIALNGGLILSLLYMTFLCTLGAQGLQMVGQKFVDTSSSALILSLESVFGLLFSLMLGNEDLTVFSAIGFALIFIAVLVSETKLKFITKFFTKEEGEKTND